MSKNHLDKIKELKNELGETHARLNEAYERISLLEKKLDLAREALGEISPEDFGDSEPLRELPKEGKK